jgi:hypothetical protein
LIKVEVIEEVKNRGVFKYRVKGMPIEGQSRQPLIDACRQIKALLGPTVQGYSVRGCCRRTSVAASNGELPIRSSIPQRAASAS